MIKTRLMFVLIALAAAMGGADARSFKHPYMPDIEPLEARGCYAYRGRITCGTYCYWEVNGLRYCQQREAEAVPQLGWWDDGHADASPYRKRRAHGIK